MNVVNFSCINVETLIICITEIYAHNEEILKLSLQVHVMFARMCIRNINIIYINCDTS